MKQKIKVCNKICSECGFTKDGTENTLYHETLGMMMTGVIFPCHMELKKISGDMSYGVEKMSEVKVCRGYVAFNKKNNFRLEVRRNPIWASMLAEISDEELDNICDIDELHRRHEALRNGWRLENNEELGL